MWEVVVDKARPETRARSCATCPTDLLIRHLERLGHEASVEFLVDLVGELDDTSFHEVFSSVGDDIQLRVFIDRGLASTELGAAALVAWATRNGDPSVFPCEDLVGLCTSSYNASALRMAGPLWAACCVLVPARISGIGQVSEMVPLVLGPRSEALERLVANFAPLS